MKTIKDIRKELPIYSTNRLQREKKELSDLGLHIWTANSAYASKNRNTAIIFYGNSNNALIDEEVVKIYHEEKFNNNFIDILDEK